jgi:hypothetical protein
MRYARIGKPVASDRAPERDLLRKITRAVAHTKRYVWLATEAPKARPGVKTSEYYANEQAALLAQTHHVHVVAVARIQRSSHARTDPEGRSRKTLLLQI